RRCSRSAAPQRPGSDYAVKTTRSTQPGRRVRHSPATRLRGRQSRWPCSRAGPHRKPKVSLGAIRPLAAPARIEASVPSALSGDESPLRCYPAGMTRTSLRADAARNRAVLVTAAREVMAERGLEAPLDEIARRADI